MKTFSKKQISADENRSPVLDGLRGCAIILVLLYHGTLFAPSLHPMVKILKRICDPGWLGVDLFFVLSGFLITRILLQSRKRFVNLRNFYIRRVLRISPLYYFFLLTVLLIVPLFLSVEGIRGYWFLVHNQMWFWLYGQNWLCVHFGRFPSFLPVHHLWSLAIEEQFYLLWPMLVFSMSARSLRTLCFVVMAGAFILRILFLFSGASWELIYVHTAARFDTIIYGGFAALLLNDANDPKRWVYATRKVLYFLPIATAIVLWRAQNSISDPWVQTIGYSLIGISFSALLIFCVTQPNAAVPDFISGRVFRFFGKHSYAIYIFHWPIYVGLAAVFFNRAVLSGCSPLLLASANLVSGAILSTGAALISWRIFERYFIQMKVHFPQ